MKPDDKYYEKQTQMETEKLAQKVNSLSQADKQQIYQKGQWGWGDVANLIWCDASDSHDWPDISGAWARQCIPAKLFLYLTSSLFILRLKTQHCLWVAGIIGLCLQAGECS